MMVLARRQGQEIRIGDDIRLVIVEIRGGQVHIGIEAPRSVPIHRLEVYEKVQARKRESQP